MLAIVAEQTGYPADMLDPDLDLEADLGIDTVKQAEMFAAIREKYGIARDDALKLRDYPTLRHVAGFVNDSATPATATPAANGTPPATATPAAATPTAPPTPAAETPPATATPAAATPAPAATAATPTTDDVMTAVLAIVAEQTGYPADMLDPDLDLEADLGIDTVKQAEMFAAIREKYGIARDDALKLRDYPTLRHVAGFVTDRATPATATPAADGTPPATATPAANGTPPATATPAAATPTASPTPAAESTATPATATPTPAAAATPTTGDVMTAVLEIVAEQTGYPADMLEPDLDLEADLGIDTVKQAEMFAAIREKYGIARDDALKLRDYPTLRHVAGFVTDRATPAPKRRAAAGTRRRPQPP